MRVAALLALALLSLAPLAPAGEFLVNGRFLYEDKAWFDEGWTGEDPLLPVRRADVTVFDLDRQRVLGRGSTDAEGRYAVKAKSKRSVGRLAVRVRTSTRHRAKAVKTFPRLKVQTPDKTVYAAWTEELFDHDPSQPAEFGTVSILRSTVGDDEGNPFNILDMGVAAFELIGDPELGVKRRGGTLRLIWPNVTGSYALGRRAWIATGDGYDDAVILHELGHLVHNVYSDSDNPGGYHTFGDSDQDPRLAFGEGWATAFAGLVLEREGVAPHYVDCQASAQVGGAQLRLALETTAPYYHSVLGASDEVAVACALFDVLDAGGSGPGDTIDDDVLGPHVPVADATPWRAFWDVFTGPVKRARAATLNSVWDGWIRKHGDAEDLEPVELIFADRAIRFVNDLYEPNDKRSEAHPLGLSGRGEWLRDLTLYHREPGSRRSGAGDRDWFALELEAGWRLDVETRYPDGAFDATSQADTWLSLHRPSGKRVARTDAGGTGRNAALYDVVIDEPGTWFLQIRTRNRVHRYGRYELRVTRVDD